MTTYTLGESSLLYFTSDTHFGHRNIIDYSSRPFKDVDHMNEMLIQNWNETVPKNGIVWHLGDFGFTDIHKIEDILGRLNGTINFILGNHDRGIRNKLLSRFKNREYLHKNKYFYNIQEINVHTTGAHSKQKIVLCHFPIESWHHIHHGTWHLHGHCHGNLSSAAHMKRMDVGVDSCSYRPIGYYEVKGIMDQRVFKAVDHHGTF